MDEANNRGIRIIIDLVVNHTSDQHPWFRAARRQGPGSKYWDYYVWSNHPPADTRSEVVVPGKQQGVWSYDHLAETSYFLRNHDELDLRKLSAGNARIVSRRSRRRRTT